MRSQTMPPHSIEGELATWTDHTGIRLYQTTNHNLIIGHVKHMVLL
jgi:hypothetical protein